MTTNLDLSSELLDGVKDIAQFLGKTERATYHLIYNGHLPVIRKGRKIYARRSELEAAFRSEAA